MGRYQNPPMRACPASISSRRTSEIVVTAVK
jgi:hypothetical protein